MNAFLHIPNIAPFVFGFASGYMISLMIGFNYLLSIEKIVVDKISELQQELKRPSAAK